MKTDITGGFDILDYLVKRYHLDTPAAKARTARDHADSEVSMMVYALRRAAGLTQAALAKRIGTTTSVVSRIEDAEYRGHSTAILRRIAEALGMKVVVRFVPRERKPRPGWILNREQKDAVRSFMVAEKSREQVKGPARRAPTARRRAQGARRPAR
jgi:transcriptional regulator with XRE-family HTH domain